jgi:hypothetical protein
MATQIAPDAPTNTDFLRPRIRKVFGNIHEVTQMPT